MLVEYVRYLKSPYITIHNPPPRSDIQLVGADGVLKSNEMPRPLSESSFPNL